MSKFKVAFAGCIRHGESYAAAIQANPAFELVAVSESRSASPEARSASHALAELYSVASCDVTDLPTSVDLVIVCTESARHAEMAERLLLAGKNVLVDEPVAINVESGRRVVEAARHSRGFGAVVTLSLTPQLWRARNYIDAGRIGLPRSINIESLSAMIGAATADSSESVSGSGVMMNSLGHLIDYTRFLTGCDPVNLFAQCATPTAPFRSAGYEDTALVSAEFTNGLVASFVLGQVPVAPSRQPLVSTIRIVGSHGHIEFDVSRPSVEEYRSGARSVLIPVEPEPFASVLEDLKSSLSSGTVPTHACEDAFMAVQSTAAAYASIREQVPVYLEGCSGGEDNSRCEGRVFG